MGKASARRDRVSESGRPRRLPDPGLRRCGFCNKQLTQRASEFWSLFLKRKTCGFKCGRLLGAENKRRNNKPKLLAMIGVRYGELVVRSIRSEFPQCECDCDCGKPTTAHPKDLTGGKRTSCGCAGRRETIIRNKRLGPSVSLAGVTIYVADVAAILGCERHTASKRMKRFGAENVGAIFSPPQNRGLRATRERDEATLRAMRRRAKRLSRNGNTVRQVKP